jgi:hypothetical protein
MTLSLREKQSLFATAVAHLILQANELGYAVTLGEAWRSREEAHRLAIEGKGIKNSLHTVRLAIDLNLFRNGEFLTESDDYKPLGLWWEAQSYDPDVRCCWGGRFYDGNHFSFAHGGRK